MPARAGGIPGVPGGVAWGETSRALLETLGTRATVLSRPIDFGDSYPDVVLRDAALGDVSMTAFFQLDKATGGLKRVQFERQRHAVNPPSYGALVRALDPPTDRPARHARFLLSWLMVIRRRSKLCGSRGADDPRGFSRYDDRGIRGCLDLVADAALRADGADAGPFRAARTGPHRLSRRQLTADLHPVFSFRCGY